MEKFNLKPEVMQVLNDSVKMKMNKAEEVSRMIRVHVLLPIIVLSVWALSLTSLYKQRRVANSDDENCISGTTADSTFEGATTWMNDNSHTEWGGSDLESRWLATSSGSLQ